MIPTTPNAVTIHAAQLINWLILSAPGGGTGLTGGGAAAVPPDVAYLNMGTAVNAGVTSPEYQFGQVYRTLAGGIPDTYILEVLQSSGNYLATWFRRALGRPELAGAPDPRRPPRATDRRHPHTNRCDRDTTVT